MQAVFEGVVHGELNAPLRDEVKKVDELGATKSLCKELRRFIPESTKSFVLLDDEDRIKWSFSKNGRQKDQPQGH